MMQVKLFSNPSQKNLITANPCFSAYKNAFDEAVKNYDPSQKKPYLHINIIMDFLEKTDETKHEKKDVKEEVMKWYSSLNKLYELISTELNEAMSDYNMGVRQYPGGCRHIFSHLLNVKGIEAMQQLLSGNSLEPDSNPSSPVCK